MVRRLPATARAALACADHARAQQGAIERVKMALPVPGDGAGTSGSPASAATPFPSATATMP
jgi:hypothetical protein